jgi:hypothetical protein
MTYALSPPLADLAAATAADETGVDRQLGALCKRCGDLCG